MPIPVISLTMMETQTILIAKLLLSSPQAVCQIIALDQANLPLVDQGQLVLTDDYRLSSLAGMKDCMKRIIFNKGPFSEHPSLCDSPSLIFSHFLPQAKRLCKQSRNNWNIFFFFSVLLSNKHSNVIYMLDYVYGNILVRDMELKFKVICTKIIFSLFTILMEMIIKIVSLYTPSALKT